MTLSQTPVYIYIYIYILYIYIYIYVISFVVFHFHLVCWSKLSEMEIFLLSPLINLMHPCWIKKQLSAHSIFLGWILNVFLTLSPVSHRSLIWWRVCDALPFLWCVNALLRFSTGTGLLARPLKKMAHLTNEKLLKMMMMKRESQMKTQKVNSFTNLVIRLMFSAYRLFCIINER